MGGARLGAGRAVVGYGLFYAELGAINEGLAATGTDES